MGDKNSPGTNICTNTDIINYEEAAVFMDRMVKDLEESQERAKNAKRSRDEMDQNEELELAKMQVNEFLSLHKEMKSKVQMLEDSIGSMGNFLIKQGQAIGLLLNENKSLKERLTKFEEKERMEVEEIVTAKGVWAEKLLGKNKTLNQDQKIQQKEQIIVANSITSEIKDQERRKKNLVIFGLDESKNSEPAGRQKDDEQKVDHIMSFLKVRSDIKIRKVIRYKLRKEEQISTSAKNPPLVIVELDSENDRNKILFAAKQLKESSALKNVYIKPDMTIAERTRFTELREERNNKNKNENTKKFRWAIRNDQVVRFKVIEKQD